MSATVNNNQSKDFSSGKLFDKVALVTGSTYGIGFSIAKRLAEDGAKVVICSRTRENVDRALIELKPIFEGRIAGTVCHVGKPEDLDHLVNFTIERFGTIHILVPNVAVNPHVGSLLDLEESKWDKIFDINLKSTFLLSQKVIPQMLKNKLPEKGAIVYISSAVGYGGMAQIGGYAISKTALLGLCKNMSLEFASQGIRVNLVAPGIIKTKFSEVLWKSGADAITSVSHLKRLGEQDEVCGAVSFFCGPDASYITGENLSVAGGYHFGI